MKTETFFEKCAEHGLKAEHGQNHGAVVIRRADGSEAGMISYLALFKADDDEVAQTIAAAAGA